MAIYFHFSVLIRTFAVTVISVVTVITVITCLISEISKAKTFKETSHPPSWIFKNIITSLQVTTRH